MIERGNDRGNLAIVPGMGFRLKLAAVIALTCVMTALTFAHVHGVNGRDVQDGLRR